MPIDPIDQVLIDQANRADASAFEKLYLRHRDWAYRLAYRFTSNHDDALDVLQETFTYFLQKFPGFELKASVTTFLYPVIKHSAVTLQQKRRHHSPTTENLPDLPDSLPMTSQSETRQELAMVLAALPAEQREIIIMKFVDGFTLQEIAQVLEIPEGTVKSRLYRALQTLKDDPRTRKYFSINDPDD